MAAETYTETKSASGDTLSITRGSDGAFIPADPDNADFQRYQVWLDDGGKPTVAESEL